MIGREQAIDIAVKRVWGASNFLGRQIMTRMADSGHTHFGGYFAGNLKRLVAIEFNKIWGVA